MTHFDADILENRAVAESWGELSFSWPDGAPIPEPGQFLTLRVSPYSDPLLRRPFAFSGFRPSAGGASAAGASASIVYQVRGGATRLLSELSAGSKLDLLAPLGKGFPMPAAGERPLLAGGGIGLGPLLFLADTLAKAAASADSPSPLLVLGLRSASQLPSIALPLGTVLCTDDGSSGIAGTPVDWLSHNLPDKDAVRLYGCGPLPMLAALAALAKRRGWAGSLSAEQWMACGVGACMGCALPRADGRGYLRACSDGPVFDAGDIDWVAGR